MKIAIKVLTEWDRENVISFFEKHYPKCNEMMEWHFVDIGLGDLLWVDEVNDLRNNKNIPSYYTIIQGVPKDMELPQTREQELEECLSNFLKLLPDYGDNNTDEWGSLIQQAKQLLNK